MISPVGDAVSAALRVLLGVSGAESVTLWRLHDDGPHVIATAGDVDPGFDAVRATAATVLRGGPRTAPHLSAATIGFADASPALLAARDPATRAGAHDALLATARPALRSLLHHDDATAAAQRQLDRLRYDLHDGPQQELHLLAQDVRGLRVRLGPMIEGHPDRDRALGLISDLESQLVSLDDDLRRLLTAAGPASQLQHASVTTTLAELADRFAERTGVVPETVVDGDVESLTASQRIALLSVVREALANVRRHADADRVQVTLTAGVERIEARVRDDGVGFTEAEAHARERAGRLGLVGMRERLAMLGGETRIESAPGGPTTVTASLPRWPVQPAAPAG